MTRIIHFLTSTGSSLCGGMEQSTLRVADYFSRIPNTKVIIYARDGLVVTEDLSPYLRSGIEFIDLKPSMDAILIRDAGFNDFIYAVALVFGSEVRKSLTRYTDGEHLIVSFYISTNGFNAQNVADELGLPHVACIRGTDFSRDYYRGDRFANIGYVVQSAALVVTCNENQKALARRVWQRNRGLVTIYNSLCIAQHVHWTPHPNRKKLRVFSDTGYSLRKGTHRLIRVFEEIIAEKAPVQLQVVGRPVEREAEFWSEIMTRSGRQDRSIRLDGYMSTEHVFESLLDADIYCTASLAEGSPNGAMNALALGMPIVAGRSGAVPELGRDFNGLFLFDPADLDEMKRKVIEAVTWVQNGGSPNLSQLAKLRSKLRPDDEAAKWTAVIDAVSRGKRRPPKLQSSRPLRDALR